MPGNVFSPVPLHRDYLLRLCARDGIASSIIIIIRRLTSSLYAGCGWLWWVLALTHALHRPSSTPSCGRFLGFLGRLWRAALLFVLPLPSPFITCLLFCHYWESMKRLQRISAISAKYSGSREIRSSEVLLYKVRLSELSKGYWALWFPLGPFIVHLGL